MKILPTILLVLFSFAPRTQYLCRFEMIDRKLARILPPREGPSYGNGINNLGEIVGTVSTFSQFEYWSFKCSQNVCKQILDQLSSPQAYGINDHGDVVGYSSFAFIDHDGSLQVLQFPGSTMTAALGINNDRKVVGTFSDSGNSYHGFLWTPPAAGNHR